MGDIARRWQQAGRPEQAATILERALEIDHTSEPLYRTLMESYMQMGRRAEMAETYGRCRKMLAATLHVDPSPETVALYENLAHAV